MRLFFIEHFFFLKVCLSEPHSFCQGVFPRTKGVFSRTKGVLSRTKGVLPRTKGVFKRDNYLILFRILGGKIRK